jgi:hypothetical protein
MNFLGVVFTTLTFPGVMVREAAHLFFVRAAKLAIFDVRFLSLRPPYGYVRHEPANHFGLALLDVLGPFFVNSALCLLFCAAAYLPVWQLQIYDLEAYFFYWLGLSLGVHAFPAPEELKHVWRLAPAAARQGSVLAILSYPLIALLALVSAARGLGADRLFGLALGVLAPIALARLFLLA